MTEITMFQQTYVGDLGITLAYTDNGPVAQSTSYTTFVAIHGLCFSSAIFKKMQAVAAEKGVRFIAINRRNYPDSTPFTPEETQVVYQGSSAQKEEWLKERGHEIAKLIDGLIQTLNLPPISADGKSGGVVFLAWSLGTGEANATIANIDTLPVAIRSRLSAYLRGFIIQATPRYTRLPMPGKDWAPFKVDSIPPELRLPFFCQWVTGYFDHHEDLAKRNLDSLEYVLPSPFRPGSIYNMSKEEHDAIVITTQQVGSVEGPYMMGFRDQLNAAFQKALFDPATREILPNLTISCLMGDRAPAFAIAGVWAIEDEAKKRGVSSIKTKLAPGANHYIHWDDPARALDLYLECVSPGN